MLSSASAGEEQKPICRGALIAIEGLDRAGKSTQCEVLLKKMEQEGYSVKLQRFPDRTTPIGKMIDNYLRFTTADAPLNDYAIHLLFSANRWELCDYIKSTIASGTTLILDRYVYSGVVFSAAKGLNYEWCLSPDLGLPRPDLVLFLDITREEAAARGGYGQERYEKAEMQEEVRILFENMRIDRDGENEEWRVVDAAWSVDKVSEDVWSTVKCFLDKVQSGEAGELGVVTS